MTGTQTGPDAVGVAVAQESGQAPAARATALWKAFAASLSGTALEYYDFALYGSAAAAVFGKLFFAQERPEAALLASFATYSVGFAARPLGGLVFGRLGDIVGRRLVLVWTLTLVGISTCMIGLLPTYATAGVLAPVLLVTLRFLQGVGVGGEWSGAVLITSELSPPGQRGFWASAAQLGPPAGTLLANGVLAALMWLPEPAFLAWGWRAAFLLSALLVGFGLWIRTHLEETGEFRGLVSHDSRAKAPVSEVLTGQRRPLAAVILARVGPDVLYAMFAVFVIAYAPGAMQVSHAQAAAAVALGSAAQLVLMPVSGWLSDRWGRRRVYAVGAVGAALWAMGFFTLAAGVPSLVIGVVGALALHSLMYGPQAAFIAEQFPAHLRSTGSALGYTFAGLIGGAIAPLIFTTLLVHHLAWSLGVYVAGACLVTLVGLGLGRGEDPGKAAGESD